MRQHFKNEAPFELAHCLVIMNTAGVHLRHKTIQLTFHENLFLSIRTTADWCCFRNGFPNSVSTSWVAPCEAPPHPGESLPPKQTAQHVSRHEPRSKKPGPGGSQPTSSGGEERQQFPSEQESPQYNLQLPRPPLLAIGQLPLGPPRGTTHEANVPPGLPAPSPAKQ